MSVPMLGPARCSPCGPLAAFLNVGSGASREVKVLGGPAGKGTTREAELEVEVHRLGLEMQRLLLFNEELSRELNSAEENLAECDNDECPLDPYDDHTDVFMDSDAVSPEEFKVSEEEPGEADAARTSSGRYVRKTSTRAPLAMETQEPAAAENGAVAAFTPEAQLGASTKDRIMNTMAGEVNAVVVAGSALGKSMIVQVAIYLVAAGFLVFVLLATSFELGVVPHEEVAGAAAHRRLSAGTSPLMKNIAFTLTTAGLMSFIVHFFQQPIVLGYILAGFVVGPGVLDIVHSHVDIQELSSLGLIFFLFMIGLEMDIHQVFAMTRKTIVTGFVQFPICFGFLYLFALILWALGFEFGDGHHSTLYVAMSAALSSTMVVKRVLDDKGGEGDSPSGRLTIGVLFCQDCWAIIIMAFQPDFAESPNAGDIVKDISIKLLVLAIALLYAKFVTPAVMHHCKKSVELMLVMSLAWCFFICSVAIMPFVGISMELAALTAGIALATFPYSAEFNAKIKYIRDFFVTLFFAGLGMQIPVPAFGLLFKAVVLSLLTVMSRTVGVCAVVRLQGGSMRLASLSAINLSQISEFALVFCVVGQRFGHITTDTMVILLFAFAILNVWAVYSIKNNYKIFRFWHRILFKFLGQPRAEVIVGQGGPEGEELEAEDTRDIVLLGFHRVAMMLLTEIALKTPEFLKKVHVIDYDKDTVAAMRKKGVKCTFVNDISMKQVLIDANLTQARIILSTIPDSMLRGTTNLEILRVAREVWPQAHYVVTADNPVQAEELYKNGADYVLRMAKLCAERLHVLLSEYETAHGEAGSQLEQLFNLYKTKDTTGSKMGMSIRGI